MNLLERSLLAGLLILSLAGGALLYLESTRPEPLSAAAGPSRPDLGIDRPHWRIFDAQGNLGRELWATRLEKWPDAAARLTLPRLELADRRAQRWQALARTGWLDDGRHLLLEEDVRLRRQPPADPLQLRTERLRFDETAGRLETDQPVVLTAGNWHFTATGLRAELDRPQLHLQLLENVRGVHD